MNFALRPTFDEATASDRVAIGEINQIAVGNCFLPGGVVMTFTLTQPGSVIAPTGLDRARGQARVEGIGLRAESAQCSFNVTGGADIDIDLAGRAVTSIDRPTTLLISGVMGCLGQVMNGIEMRLVGTFAIT